jgi:hypothetical protein
MDEAMKRETRGVSGHPDLVSNNEAKELTQEPRSTPLNRAVRQSIMVG